MQVPEASLTQRELDGLKDQFLANTTLQIGHRTHNNCGGAIRVGFVNCFAVDSAGTVDLGPGDGFGLGPQKVPYCEKCDPPDGFNHTYSRRVLIRE